MNQVAFYGTLLSVHGAQDHLGIRDRCRLIGTCSIPGRLYDFGRYPALVAGPGAVHGELYEVDDEVLAVVDAFEGPDYRRERIRLLEPDREAWVYRYDGDLTGALPIESGDYRTGNSGW